MKYVQFRTITRQIIVEGHGGVNDVNSVIGGGTEFVITLLMQYFGSS